MSLIYEKLEANYPNEEKEELFRELGGEWPSLINNSNYNNTCAVRLSIALRKSGNVIPKSIKEAIDGAGNPLILKVKTMDKFIKSLLGDSSWGMSKQPGSILRNNSIPQTKGIIAYHVDWTNATGHFDLWDGKNFYGNGNLEDVKDGFDIVMWFLD